MKNLEYYLGLPYGIGLRKDDEGDWVAKVEELPGCTAHGATAPEALERLESVKKAWVEDAIEAGDAIPEPGAEPTLPSGKWLQRVPRSLHKKISEMAEKEGVSLNQLVTSVLAEAAGTRKEGAAIVLAEASPEPTARRQSWSRWHTHGWDSSAGPNDRYAWSGDPHKPAEFVIELLGSKMLSKPKEVCLLHGTRHKGRGGTHIWTCLADARGAAVEPVQDQRELGRMRERASKKETAYKSR